MLGRTNEQLRAKEEMLRKEEMDELLWEPSQEDKKRKEELEELKVFFSFMVVKNGDVPWVDRDGVAVRRRASWTR